MKNQGTKKQAPAPGFHPGAPNGDIKGEYIAHHPSILFVLRPRSPSSVLCPPLSTLPSSVQRLRSSVLFPLSSVSILRPLASLVICRRSSVVPPPHLLSSVICRYVDIDMKSIGFSNAIFGIIRNHCIHLPEQESKDRLPVAQWQVSRKKVSP